jgi:hypothetical protein
MPHARRSLSSSSSRTSSTRLHAAAKSPVTAKSPAAAKPPRRAGRSSAPTVVLTLCGGLFTVVYALGGCSGEDPDTAGAAGNPSASAGSTMGPSGPATGTGGDLFGTSGSGSGAGGAPVDCDDDKTTGPVMLGKAFGDVQSQYGTAVTTDASGNIIVTGAYQGSVNFGGAALTSAGGNDIFLAKFNAAGEHVWSKSFGGGKDQSGRAVTTDPLGNVYVTGVYLGTVDFGGATLSNVELFLDVFVAKFDAQGAFQWAKGFGDFNTQTARGIGADATGNVVVVGDFQGSVDFGGGALTATPGGAVDVFAVKFNPMGGHVWSKKYGGDQDQSAEEVAIDAAGNAYMTGYAKGTIDFGTGALTGTQNLPLAFVTKLDASGGTVWSKGYGNEARGLGIDVNGPGNIAVVGAFKGTIDFGGGNLPSMSSNDSVFVARLDPQGKHVWSHVYGTGSAEATSVVLDSKGKVIVGGSFTDTIDFGGPTLKAAGVGLDAFLAKLDTVGCYTWGKQFGDDPSQSTQALALDASDNVVVLGNFSGNVDFGNGAVMSAGDDVFIAKFAP